MEARKLSVASLLSDTDLEHDKSDLLNIGTLSALSTRPSAARWQEIEDFRKQAERISDLCQLLGGRRWDELLHVHGRHVYLRFADEGVLAHCRHPSSAFIPQIAMLAEWARARETIVVTGAESSDCERTERAELLDESRVLQVMYEKRALCGKPLAEVFEQWSSKWAGRDEFQMSVSAPDAKAVTIVIPPRSRLFTKSSSVPGILPPGSKSKPVLVRELRHWLLIRLTNGKEYFLKVSSRSHQLKAGTVVWISSAMNRRRRDWKLLEPESDQQAGG